LKLSDADLISIHINKYERPLLQTDFQAPNSSPMNKPVLFRNGTDKRPSMLQKHIHTIFHFQGTAVTIRVFKFKRKEQKMET
jgi:hypothetical protein